VRTNWVRVRALLIASAFAAVAAFFDMARNPTSNASVGSPYALRSITAAVLGGASLAGGRATFVGTTVSSVLLALLLTALPFLGLRPEDGPMIIGLLVLAGIVLFQFGDLKELVKRNFRRARRLVQGSRIAESAELPAFYAEGTDFGAVPTSRILIKNGTVLTVDPSLGAIDGGDVLIEGQKIVAVGPPPRGPPTPR
jgi:hypothetical protein